jgi:hypothetical protein
MSKNCKRDLKKNKIFNLIDPYTIMLVHNSQFNSSFCNWVMKIAKIAIKLIISFGTGIVK